MVEWIEIGSYNLDSSAASYTSIIKNTDDTAIYNFMSGNFVQ